MTDKILKTWRRRFADYKNQETQYRRKAENTIPQILQILMKYAPTRIVLFGSLTKGDRFSLHSDIDIAVEGIPRTQFFRAYADLMMSLDVPIDLKPVEDLEGPILDRIAKEGRLLYEAKTGDSSSCSGDKWGA